ncbi:glycosyltransferase [Microbulbifer sp. EKSA005]|uniref:glycosyltransferase n=1 Tax=Microbulbifer sp. EKSA005 TaxID=3243364 RepID=UPI00404247C8
MKSSLPSLQVIITAHKEGALLLPTMESAQVSITELKRLYDVEVECLLFLDKSDELTINIAEELAQMYGARVLYGEEGDPGQARLRAISSSNKDMIALLDGDDLWSENWLSGCYEVISSFSGKKALKNSVLHPEYNLIFGAHSMLVRQGDPSDKFFDPEFLRVGNYWDALCLAHRSIFDKYPYKKNDLDSGHAHEDFYWACETYLGGVNHLLVKDSVHFKRRRGGSVSVIADSKKVKPLVSNINFY